MHVVRWVQALAWHARSVEETQAVPSKSGWGVLRDAALLLGLGTAFLYFAGRSYLEAKYWRLGLTAEEVSPSTPGALMASFFPLLAPAVLLALVGVLCLSIRKDAPDLRNPFAPLSTLQVLTTVFGLLSFKLLLDVTKPDYGARWLLWHPRDVVFLALGAGLLAWQYHQRLRTAKFSRWRISRLSRLAIGLAITVYGLTIASLALSTRWPLDATQTGLLLFLLPWTSLLIYRDLRRQRGALRRENEPDPKEHPRRSASLWSATTKGSQLFLGLMVAMTVTLGTGLRGNAEAGELIAGCDRIKTIAFDPWPAGLDQNHTYWMVLHDHGTYYVRDLNATWSAGVWAVPEKDGMTAHTMTLAARRTC